MISKRKNLVTQKTYYMVSNCEQIYHGRQIIIHHCLKDFIKIIQNTKYSGINITHQLPCYNECLKPNN